MTETYLRIRCMIPAELEEELPQLSLDELDIALNPGGGTDSSLAGDFFVPNVSALFDTSQQNLKAFVDFADLDRKPRPIGVFGFHFPRRLLKQKVNGKIVLLLKLDDEGEVLDVQIDFSNLPDFNDFVLREVRGAVVDGQERLRVGAVVDVTVNVLPPFRLGRCHQTMARQYSAVGSDHHRLLLGVDAQAFPQNRQLVLRVAAVVSGVGAQSGDLSRLGRNPRGDASW